MAQLERAGNPDATVEDYFRVIDRKTASLIAWCARVGGSVDAGAGGAARALRPRARARLPDRRRRARQRHRRGDRRQVGRARPAGGEADAAGAAGLRGRPGAGPAHPQAARRAGRAGRGRGRDPRRRPRGGRRRAGAPEGGARSPTRRSRALEALPASPLPRRACARSPICRRTGAPDVARRGGSGRADAAAAVRTRARRRARALGGSGVVRPLPRAARAAPAHHARGRSEPGGQRDRAAGGARGRAGAAVRAGDGLALPAADQHLRDAPARVVGAGRRAISTSTRAPSSSW